MSELNSSSKKLSAPELQTKRGLFLCRASRQQQHSLQHEGFGKLRCICCREESSSDAECVLRKLRVSASGSEDVHMVRTNFVESNWKRKTNKRKKKKFRLHLLDTGEQRRNNQQIEGKDKGKFIIAGENAHLLKPEMIRY